MALNELRPLKIKVGSKIIAEELRIRVQGSKNMTLLPDFFVVEIYNLGDDDMYTLNNGGKLSVTGQDGGLLCSGEIDDIYTKIVQTNRITSISVVDGKSFWATRINKSFGGGSSVKTTFESIVSGAYRGAFCASDVRMTRGQTYTGRVAENVSMLAKSVHGRAYITNGTVYISTKGMAAETITIDESDVINQDDSATGLKIVQVSVKGYPIGALTVLGRRKYRLVSQKFSADNYEGPWESHLILVIEEDVSYGGMEGG